MCAFHSSPWHAHFAKLKKQIGYLWEPARSSSAKFLYMYVEQRPCDAETVRWPGRVCSGHYLSETVREIAAMAFLGPLQGTQCGPTRECTLRHFGSTDVWSLP